MHNGVSNQQILARKKAVEAHKKGRVSGHAIRHWIFRCIARHSKPRFSTFANCVGFWRMVETLSHYIYNVEYLLIKVIEDIYISTINHHDDSVVATSTKMEE